MKPESALMVFAAIVLTCAGVVWMNSKPIGSIPPGSQPTTTTTECQDHTLPCAGPPVTDVTPTMDPAKHDDGVIDRTIHESSTTTPATLPRTS